MTLKARIAITTFLFLLAGMGLIWWWNSLPRPYERPPGRTQAEQVKVDLATHKIGRHVVITGVREIIIQMEDGQTRKIRRG